MRAATEPSATILRAALMGLVFGVAAAACSELRHNGADCLKGRDCESGFCRSGTCVAQPTNNPSTASVTTTTTTSTGGGGGGGGASTGGSSAGGSGGAGGAGGAAGGAGGT